MALRTGGCERPDRDETRTPRASSGRGACSTPARPSTADDMTILWDGRRLDSREAVMVWLAEVGARRAEEVGAGSDAEA